MANSHEQQLIRMAHQITLNMAAEGDAQTEMAAAHIRKFWTPVMRQRLVEHSGRSSEEFPPAVRQVVELLARTG